MFIPGCLPVLIGSLPITGHREAVELIFSHTPDLPLWPQLPKNEKETMVRQFLDGFPGLVDYGKKFWIDDTQDRFTECMTAFYEDCLAASTADSVDGFERFALNRNTARGFFTLLEFIAERGLTPAAVKGQVTGPITTGIGTKDAEGNYILYNADLCDMLTSLLALKARWQVEQFRQHVRDAIPIVFIDEPAMVNFGSTSYAGVTRELVCRAVGELTAVIQRAGGLAGIHICANGDWAPVLDSDTDIVSFDAYSYFENFALYRDQLCGYINRGGMLAWGIVPTSSPEAITEASVDSLYHRWLEQLKKLESYNISADKLLRQTLIAPACGTGSLPRELAVKVLALTSDLSAVIRRKHASALS